MGGGGGADEGRPPSSADRPEAHRRRTSLSTRLTWAFFLVAVGTGALLVVTTYLFVAPYRSSTFERRSENAARLALLSAPEDLTTAEYEDLLLQYQERGAIDGLTVVGGRGERFNSFLETVELPPASELQEGLVSIHQEIEGRPYLVVAGAQGDARYGFAFSEEALRDSIRETRDVLLIGWLVASVVAALLGRRIARRTLVPVRDAANASRSLADGALDTRLVPGGSDELATLAEAFNAMADALEGKIDELSAAAARERRFTANVAHDLRTPLTSMTSAASLLEDRVATLPDDARRPLELLLQDVHRLQSLVLDLLELARHDAGEEVVEAEALRADEAVAAVVAATSEPERVEVDVAPGLVVLADRRRFGRVVGNLLDNALAHTDGAVEVEGAAEGPMARIDVLDHGPGLEGLEPERLFDRFYKGDHSRSSAGSGLGLSIVAENARLQGGSVEATDRAGGGARFSFRLPRATDGARPD